LEFIKLNFFYVQVLESAGNAARANKKNRIIPRHLLLAVRKDEELEELLAGVTIAYGGVLPNIFFCQRRLVRLQRLARHCLRLPNLPRMSRYMSLDSRFGVRAYLM